MSYCYNNGVYVAEPKSSARLGAAARRRTATAAQRRGRRPASSGGGGDVVAVDDMPLSTEPEPEWILNR
jgi:hypothetical protein